jgi:uncharacterized phage protein (TIGR02216 family)
MATGLGLLRLSPAQFWSMTPRELAAACRGLGAASSSAMPIGRHDLARLMRQFPDA